MKENKIIIAGSRNCPEKDNELFLKVMGILSNIDLETVEIVSGTCKGADKFGENLAKEMLLPVKKFPADWENKGKSAGYIRNKQMAEYGTHLIALWDGKSKGTKNMIDVAKQNNLKVKIINYENSSCKKS